MRARVERLVEDDNEVREALARTRVEQARTRRQVLEARQERLQGRQIESRLAAARAVGFARGQLGKPYMWGRPGPARTTAPARA